MNVDDARDDLAFIRALVAPEDHWQRQFGRIYAAAGVCYAIQMLLHIGQFLNVTPRDGLGAQAIGWGPSIVFLGILFWILRRDGPQPGGVTSRAVGAVFAAVGFTNLALCASIGSVALRLHSQTIWLIYPCVVMVLQGLAWMVAFMMRRRPWLLAVAVGWFATGVAMAIFIDNMVGYVAAATVGVVCFMLTPGLYLARQASRDA
ncbi:hypothetical protein [Phenylobacterium sp.]|uniref:hypothetical protein n=1 Tax=Phenylobacterium sp. TaxID=1871053 RepID=UPI00122AE67B|nr:hypothetical protein [Phenylobacterium sp.]THD58812.1 MAG: hypothetical protein E8A49_17610 [Phenylobacterium sp.]